MSHGSFNWEDILQSLGGKRAGTLQSPAPGTGPTEHDSTATPPKPGFLGGASIPATTPQTDSGYGGSGDPTPPNAPHTLDVAHVPPAIPGAIVPRLNTLYGPLRTSGDSWRFVNRGIVTGTWTPVSGTQALIPLALTQANLTPTKLYEFAGAVSAYWVLQYFSFAPVAAGMTGSQAIAFQPNNGDNLVPLGVYNGGILTGGISTPIVVDAPFTDPTSTGIGALQVTGNTIATPAVCAYQFGIGIAYLLPQPLNGMFSSDAEISKQQAAVQRRG